MTARVQLYAPNREMLAEYVGALEAGWSPSTTRDLCAEHLAAIHADPDAFVRAQQERAGRGIVADGGATVPRLPGPLFWISDGEFCGQINLRYQEGTLELPPYVSGHLGYSVVPWKRRQGIATAALRLLLPIAAARGLSQVQITCDIENLASRRVIEACGGVYAGDVPAAEHEGVMKSVFWATTG